MPLRAQVAANCSDGTVVGSETYSGTVFFNYGGTTNSITSKNRTTGALGESFIGPYLSPTFNGVAGFFSRFLLPPSAPLVYASEGDLEDRIQVNWVVDPLSPSAEGGFNIYRDGAFIGHVDKEIRIYVDFNVQAGKFYNYQITGVNTFGEGSRGSGLGFLNPNGVITGQVKTFNGSPVLDAAVTLSPTLGTALTFTGDDLAFAEFQAALHSAAWTVSTWVKIGANPDPVGTSIIDFGSPTQQNWWLHTLGSGVKGIRFGVGNTSSSQSAIYTFATDPDGWHHIAAAYSGATLLLYVDGNLVATQPAPIAQAALPLFFGKRPTGAAHHYTGGLDEVRLFNRQLSQTEINMFKNRTVNSDAPGLVAYWKLDEGVGVKAYDLSPNHFVAYLCGAAWSADRADVVNGAVTDEAGFYKIEGINYGGGTTFTAVPSKQVFSNYALEFNAANQHYAVLTDEVLLGAANAAAIEVWVQNFENTASPRTVLANQSANGAIHFFEFNVVSGNIQLIVGGVTQSFGALGTGYQHLVFNLKKNGGSTDVTVYKNGTLLTPQTYAAALPDFSPQTWRIGARKTAASHDQFFSGLIDEVAFYDTTLTQPQAQTNFAQGVDAGSQRLRSWFPLNESRGAVLEDIGPARTGKGTVQGALWSSVTGISSATMHEFQPDKRLVTLNASNTSADQIDFIDLSTVAVTGYVRFDGTDCFAEGVEILGDGLPFAPPVMTDVDGKFTVDLEPGATVRLSPRFKNHTFLPANWEVANVVSPVAGILFRDMTKRFVRGQMAGNAKCRKSIIPLAGLSQAKVKVETLDGCYYREMTLPDVDGKFVFNDLPPVTVTVAVTSHPDAGAGGILEYFQNKGGTNTDLSEVSDTVDFIYYAPPQVEISELPTNECGQPMLEQSEKYTLDFRVFQQYEGGVDGKCYLDSALLHIENGFSDQSPLDTVMSGGKFRYRFPGGMPNLAAPHLKTLTVEATANDRSATEAVQAVVLGKRPRNINFVSTTPELPVMILRDPPGDASNATVEKGRTVCNGWSLGTSASATASEELEVSIGFDTEIATGIGVEKTFQIDVTNTSTFGITGTVGSSVSAAMETCVTATDVISTSDGDGIIGADADVYVGGALNLLFGITDDLRLDTTGGSCTFFRDTGVVVFPEKFVTNFFYTDHFIRNTLIPNLDIVGDVESADAWRNILMVNENLKAQAAFEQNISIDAGVLYENSVTTETTKSLTYGFNVEVTNSIAEALGIELDGVGVTQTFGFELTVGVETELSEATTNSLTVGYALADDDIGDNFTVNVLRDKVYGTPVFKTVSGNSSCPYEPTTVPRDGVEMTVDKTIESNVSDNAAAVFRFTLGNISETDEEREYVLALNPASNPDGAIVNIQGLGSSVPFSIPAFESQEVVVTVERGPVAFDYENLEFVLYADCEGADSDDPNFAKTIELDVNFIEPCSPVDIGLPFQNWVLTPASGTTLFITINEFDNTDVDLELIRVQYRRTQGDGAWINIVEVLKADLVSPVFHIVEWNTTGLKDGLYEIRAVTQCFGAQNAGISRVIQGKIEREPPEIFGTPQPADGVLSSGDEISITFTEPIRCDQLIQADITQNNNIGLYYAATGELIDATITCSGDKIVIVPKIANQFIEGKFLRVEVDNIKDLVGNTFIHAEWEFFVSRSLLDHEGGDLNVTMYEGEEKTELRTLTNVGGAIATFKITGSPSIPLNPSPDPVPVWATIYPNLGSLLPGEETVITYKFDKTLPQGIYRDTVYFNNGQGDERVIINLRVLCPPPEWEVNTAAHPHTMNFTVKLDIEGTLSADEEDIVAAFIGGELRGTAKIRLLPTLPPAGTQYMAFLTVYGDDADQDEPIDLEIWDASACLRYDQVIEQFDFEVDRVWGNLTTPIVLHTNSMIRRDIPITTGWNWLSFNLVFPNPAPTAALASLQHPEDDLIKGQVLNLSGQPEIKFAVYSPPVWAGSLTALNNQFMFQYRADQPDTLQMVGALIDPASLQIPIFSGWNWIGYVPNYALPVSTALAGLTPLNGDIIKGQTAFAQYLAGFGWLGSLQFMEPPKGYQLKISNAGTLIYPPQPPNKPSGGSSHPLTLSPSHTFWEVDATQYEHSMTLVGMFSANGQNATLTSHELGAFANGQVRGAAQALYIEPLNTYLFFLTVYANAQGEQLQFKLYDSATGQVSNLAEKMYFVSDLHQGSIESPVPFTLSTSGVTAAGMVQYLEIQPNPFSDATTIRFASAQAQEVRLLISDATGRTVFAETIAATQGLNTLRWEASSASAGVYFVRLEAGEGTAVRKVVRE